MNRRPPHHDIVLNVVNSQLEMFGAELEPIVQISPSVVYWQAQEIHPSQYGYFASDRKIEKYAEHHKLERTVQRASKAMLEFTSSFELVDESGSKTILLDPHHMPIHERGENGIERIVSRIKNKPEAQFIIGGDPIMFPNNRQDGYSLMAYAQLTEEEVKRRRMLPEMTIPVFQVLLDKLRSGEPFVNPGVAIDTFQNKRPKGRLRTRF